MRGYSAVKIRVHGIIVNTGRMKNIDVCWMLVEISAEKENRLPHG
jgi:hypothetical protein